MLKWIEEHPLLSGVLVLGLVLLYFLWRARSSGGSDSSGVVYAGPSESLQALQLQAGAATQSAQLQSNFGIAQLNAAVNVAQLQAGAQTEADRLQAQVQLQQVVSGYGSLDRQTDAGLTLGLAGLGVTTYAPSGGGFNIVYGRATDQALAAQSQQTQSSAGGTIASGGTVPTLPGGSNPAGSVGGGYSIPPGGNYATFIAANVPGYNPGDFNPSDVAAHTALVDAANAAYVSNPCSAHNIDYSNPSAIPAACGGGSPASGSVTGSTPVITAPTITFNPAGARGGGLSNLNVFNPAGSSGLFKLPSLVPTPTDFNPYGARGGSR